MSLFKSKAVICSALLLALGLKSSAQCTVSTLDIGTGISNGVNTPTPGHDDHYWVVFGLSSPISVHYPTFSFPRPARIPSSLALGWSSSALAGNQWITINDSTGNPGYYDSVANQYYATYYQRTFTLCHADYVTFNFRYLDDNYVEQIVVDGTIGLGGTQASTSANVNSYTTTSVNKTVFLPAGTHTLQVNVRNTPVPTKNPTGLCVQGNINTATSSIVNDENPSCTTYVCADNGDCNDLCYWRVTGNNINGDNNLFGTLNESDVRIITNGSERGILTQGGPSASDPAAGRLGWNTMTPTARLHVDCINGNNEENRPNATSDIRFENLEPGGGNILVIDNEGYVYNSGSYIDYKGFMAMKDELSQLRNEVTMLKNQLSPTSVTDAAATQKSWLGQNTPNPFGQETSIEYSIVNMQQSAFIIVYDLSGKELKKYPVAGKGKVTLSSEALTSGMYLYGLIVDGKEIDVKKVTLTK